MNIESDVACGDILSGHAVLQPRRYQVTRNHHVYGWRSERGTEVAALFYSLVESAKLAGVEPEGYLRTAARQAIRSERIPLPHELATG